MNRLFYYISYRDCYDLSGRSPDIELELLQNIDDARELIASWTSDYFSWSYEYEPNVLEPIIITNDPRLFLKYRVAFCENEFKNWCKFKVVSKNNKSYYFNLVSDENGHSNSNNGLSRGVGEEIYNQFINILNGEYDYARNSYTYDSVYDDDTGNFMGEFINNNGWETRKLDLKFSEDKNIQWWLELSDKWKKIFNRISNQPFYIDKPYENSINQIVNLDKIKISDAELSYVAGGSIHFSWIKTLNYSPLKYLKNLKELYGSGYNIEFIDDLFFPDSLEILDLSNCKIRDLKFLKNLINLKKLVISDNVISSLEGLENLLNLEILICNRNQIKNLWPLSNLIKLIELDCSSNNITGLIPLKSIKKLNIENNNISLEDIKNFARSTNLDDSKIKYSK